MWQTEEKRSCGRRRISGIKGVDKETREKYTDEGSWKDRT